MPNSILFVDPSVTTANGIVVDGVALIGPSNIAPTTSSIDSECPDGCPDCPPAPVPCTCPGGLASSYTWNSNGGSVTLELLSPCVWEWESAGNFSHTTLSLSATPPCGWEVQVEIYVTGTCQTFKMTGASPIGTYPDFDCDGVGGSNNSIST